MSFITRTEQNWAERSKPIDEDLLVNLKLLYFLVNATHLYIMWSEKKLSVKIWFLDDIHVCDGDAAVLRTGQTDHGKILQKFTTDGSRTNLKYQTEQSQFLLIFSYKTYIYIMQSI